jgi:uracil-DNA glycosylase
VKVSLPADWQRALGDELQKPYFKQLEKYVDEARAKHEIFPPESEVFSAFELAPLDGVKVLLLGQDPYHDNNQAHGLCFSVKPGISTPPSLANMYKELETDIPGFKRPRHGYLTGWAKQGMLMINAVLTVQAHTPNSHKDQGWEQFTDAAIKVVNAKKEHVVFVLWGGYARKKAKLIDRKKHTVIEGAHPSPLSVKLFMGSKPFSQVNAALEDHGQTPIDWSLPMSV